VEVAVVAVEIVVSHGVRITILVQRPLLRGAIGGQVTIPKQMAVGVQEIPKQKLTMIGAQLLQHQLKVRLQLLLVMIGVLAVRQLPHQMQKSIGGLFSLMKRRLLNLKAVLRSPQNKRQKTTAAGINIL
jgi:hypothetical protein